MGFLEARPRDALLVRAAVGAGPAATAAWDAWFDGVDLDDVPYSEARVLPRVFANFKRHGLAASLPPRLRGQYRWVWASNQLRIDAVAPALHAIGDAGVPLALLKGAGLLALGRCPWGAREMGDVDVLVPTSRLGAAAEALESAGWGGVLHVGAGALTDRLVTRRHSWNFAGAPSGELDLHWHVFESTGGLHADDDLWRAACAATLLGLPVTCLDPADQLVHVLEHAAHGEPAHGLQWVLDAADLLEPADEGRLVRTTKRSGLHEVVADGLERAGALLDSRRAAELARRIASSRRGARARAVALTDGTGRMWRYPRLSELARIAAVQGASVRHPIRSIAAVRRRCVEPGLVRHPVVSTIHALAGRPRRVEAALLRAFGPLARPRAPRTVPTGEWFELTPGGLDAAGGPGWSWPEPDDAGPWTDGAEARLVLDVDAPRGSDLVLGFRLGPQAHESPNPSVHVLVNARPVTGWELGAAPERGSRHVDVPAWLADWSRPIEVVLRPRRVFDPRARHGEAADRRRFVQVQAVRVDLA